MTLAHKTNLLTAAAATAAAIITAAVLVLTACTPAERQAFQSGMLTGATACVYAARCAGVQNLADFCSLTKEAVAAAEKALGDAFCEVPEAGARD